MAGAILATLDRWDYWQCAFVSQKAVETLRELDLDAFRNVVARVAPEFPDRVDRLIGGFGIHLAVQDSVAAANILGAVLKIAPTPGVIGDDYERVL